MTAFEESIARIHARIEHLLNEREKPNGGENNSPEIRALREQYNENIHGTDAIWQAIQLAVQLCGQHWEITESSDDTQALAQHIYWVHETTYVAMQLENQRLLRERAGKQRH